MALPSRMQGRVFGPNELTEIHALLQAHPDWSRYQLSRQLARQWNWYSSSGQLKDMAARTLLVKLATRGWIELPALRMTSPTRSGRRAPALPVASGLEEALWSGSLSEVRPLQISEVSQAQARPLRLLLENCLHQYHYLGYQARVGENLQYWVQARDGRPLACVVFGAAAWRCAPRDRWIGWTDTVRAARLEKVVNNTRFLLFPWVQVPQLASHILGQIAARIAADWRSKYLHSIELLETFVERSHFHGTCYRAANWLRVGQTQGRGRQSSDRRISTTIKDVYLYALHPHCQRHLCAETDPATTLGGSRIARSATRPVAGGFPAAVAEDP